MRLGADLESAAARSTALLAWAFRSAPRGLYFCHPFSGAWPIVSRTPRGDLVAKREGRKARNEQPATFPSWRPSLRYTYRMTSTLHPRHTPVLTHHRGPDSSRHHDPPFRSEGSLHVVYHAAALGIKTPRAAWRQFCARCPRQCCGRGPPTAPTRCAPRARSSIYCKCRLVQPCARIGG